MGSKESCLTFVIIPFNSPIFFLCMPPNLFITRPIGSAVSGIATPSGPVTTPVESLKYQSIQGNLDFAMKTQYVSAEPIVYGCDEFKCVSSNSLGFAAS